MNGATCFYTFFQYFFYLNNAFTQNSAFISMFGTRYRYFVLYMQRSETTGILFDHIQSPASASIHISNIQLLYHQLRISILNNNIIYPDAIELFFKFKIMIMITKLHPRFFA